KKLCPARPALPRGCVPFWPHPGRTVSPGGRARAPAPPQCSLWWHACNDRMKTPGGHDRRLVVWLSLAQLITWGSVFYTFAVLLEPVERELGLTRAQSSLAFSLALFAEGVCAWPVGRWIDRGHERAVMTGGSLLIV